MIPSTHIAQQRGSVIFYILIAIALFAALSFVVSGMTRSSSGIASQADSVYATEILAYGRGMREAVQGLRISNGCADTEISFERSPFDGSDTTYVNAGSPPDFSCHVFHANGGAYKPTLPSARTGAASWVVTGQSGVQSVGDTSTSDLILVFEDVKQGICTQVNDLVEVTNPSAAPPEDSDTLVLTAFTGAYAASSQLGASTLAGVLAGCVWHSASSTYNAYQVLIAR